MSKKEKVVMLSLLFGMLYAIIYIAPDSMAREVQFRHDVVANSTK